MPNLHRSQAYQAFSVIELAVILVIAGLLTSLMLQVQKTNKHNENCVVQTRAQLASIQAAIEHFVQVNARYPAPAARNLGSTRTTFGHEDTSYATTDTLSNAKPIVFGSLPFASLGLASSYANDCWGNQFSYFVTQSLTTSAGYQNSMQKGGLTLNSGNMAAPVPIASDVAYAVISHGENGTNHGAVKPNYMSASHRWCSAGDTIDSENCDITNPVLFNSTYNNGPNAGADYFDDLIVTGNRPTFVTP